MPGCALISPADYDARMDLDGDGVSRPLDCDDDDVAVLGPGDFFADADADGFGGGSPSSSCVAPDGFVPDGTDCDDTVPAVNPAGVELCNGIDDNCNAVLDEDAAADAPTWYADRDGDSYGDPRSSVVTCYRPIGYVDDETDCDDGDVDAHPGLTEICGNPSDEDCVDGADADCDNDGYDAPTLGGDDCDDGDPTVNPGQNETCGDDVDNDCDGSLAGHCTFVGESSLADAAVVITGTPGTYAGQILIAGDFNGDGLSDVVAEGYYASDGIWAVFNGSLNGDMSTTDADAVLSNDGAPTGCRSGSPGQTAVAATDLDGDGNDDLAVSAYSGTGDYALAVMFGPLAPLSTCNDAGEVLNGDNDQFGLAVSAAGDTDGDGFFDMIIGAQGANASYRGGAQLLLGGVRDSLSTEGPAIVGESAFDYAGAAVAGGGDISGDGLDDLVIGARCASSASARGASYVLYGPISGAMNLADADAILTGVNNSDWSGYTVAVPGDTDGDGYSDVLIGSINASAAEYLFLGPVSGTQSVLAADATFHAELADGTDIPEAKGAGDIDGSGTADLIFGHYDGGGTEPAGQAYLVLTPVVGDFELSASDGRFRGAADGDGAGVAVSAAGDVDGDSYDDVVIGAPWASGGSGAVYLIFGGPE